MGSLRITFLGSSQSHSKVPILEKWLHNITKDLWYNNNNQFSVSFIYSHLHIIFSSILLTLFIHLI